MFGSYYMMSHLLSGLPNIEAVFRLMNAKGTACTVAGALDSPTVLSVSVPGATQGATVRNLFATTSVSLAIVLSMFQVNCDVQ